MSNALEQVRRSGQSVWLDFIARSFLRSDALSTMVEKEGLLGMTSNPAIFQKAIAGSDDYDEEIQCLLERGVDGPMALYESLAIEDIQAAAELLRPVYDETDAEDGYVSLEVSPYLAHDTAGTIAEARRLYKAVDRNNVMIKIPGTPAGIPAIRTLISEGIPINVTLLFSLAAYEEAAEAYLAGLEDRVHRGLPLNTLASVASFFISRIDVAVDRALEEHTEADSPARELSGKIAIANAKVAYERFQELSMSPRWKALADHGALPQRLLWASTSTKNPGYPKTYYVSALNGPDTVNTLPLETYEALREEASVETGLVSGLETAQAQLAQLGSAGIDLDSITDQLLHDGVVAFAESFDVLLASVEKKRTRLLGDRISTQHILPGEISDAFTSQVSEWQAARTIRRIWQKDASVWSGGDEGQWLGWLTAVEDSAEHAGRWDRLEDQACRAGFEDVVVLGMGGSSLCPWVLAETFGESASGLKLHVLDSVVPEQIRRIESAIDVTKTLFIVASKSGGTVEPNALWSHFESKLEEAGADVLQHAIVITDPGSSLEAAHQRNAFRALISGEPTIGGRYSALSPFGMVPAALMGISVEDFLGHARRMVCSCGPDVPAAINPGVQLGLLWGTAALNGRDKLTVYTSPALASFGAWLEQLVAESTGKSGLGIVPVAGEPISAPEAIGNDRVFVYLRDEKTAVANTDAAIDRLSAAGHPTVRIDVPSVELLGQEFFRFEMATAVAGAVLQINPFDQPDVEAAKLASRELLASFEANGALPTWQPEFSEPGNEGSPSQALGSHSSVESGVKALLASIRPGDYFAIQSYTEMSPDIEASLTQIRDAVREEYRVATTLGYGPRFLHSTGQLHKGGKNNGVYLLITAEADPDLTIPESKTVTSIAAGSDAPLTFGTLASAQARGDFAVLDQRGRRVVHLHLTGPVARELPRLAALVARLRQHRTETSLG